MAHGRTTALTLHLTPEERLTLLAWQRRPPFLRGGPDAGALFYSSLRAGPSAFPVHRRNFVRQIRIAFVNNHLQGLAENEG